MKKFPNALVIMLGAILLAWILTFLIPQGTYQRIEQPESGRTTVVPGSFAPTAAPHPGVLDLFRSVPEGLIDQASLIALIFLLGGGFYVIEKSGALGQGLQRIVGLMKGREPLALLVVSLLFATAGATIGMQEEIIAMAPVLIVFCRSLGFNALVFVAILFFPESFLWNMYCLNRPIKL